MRAEPAVVPVLPRYGESTLSDLASSLLASLGIGGEANPLGLPGTARACLLVVDGLGWELLRDQPASAPFLSELAVNGAPLTAGFPATTVTSLSSLGTGRPPGQHGMLGYQVAIPGKNKLLGHAGFPPILPGGGVRSRGAGAAAAPHHRAARVRDAGGLCVIDWENSGAADPSHELGCTAARFSKPSWRRSLTVRQVRAISPSACIKTAPASPFTRGPAPPGELPMTGDQHERVRGDGCGAGGQ